MAGIISALRWSPDSTWIISAVDMPMMTREAYAWLLDLRRPGVWAVLPRKTPEGPAETAGACYEPEIKEYLEDQAVRGNLRLQPLSRHPRARVPEIPSSLSCAWYNINTPRDWQAVVDNGDADGLN
jgi:molybdopterin-guanine dinucleotide biosynthesis protein A